MIQFCNIYTTFIVIVLIVQTSIAKHPSIKTANEKFKTCCAKHISEKCANEICSYNVTGAILAQKFCWASARTEGWNRNSFFVLGIEKKGFLTSKQHHLQPILVRYGKRGDGQTGRDTNTVKSALSGIFSSTCAISEMKLFQQCASNFKDNSKCCQSKGFLKGYEVCEQFCNPGGKFDWPSTLFGAIKFSRCNDVHDKIFECHYLLQSKDNFATNGGGRA
uniref:Domain of unknown function DB domain-containing protein n=1 Tax=Romanomermis culicivorax TaxID=13658 RepID=A0A915KEZ2_ROMCU